MIGAAVVLGCSGTDAAPPADAGSVEAKDPVLVDASTAVPVCPVKYLTWSPLRQYVCAKPEGYWQTNVGGQWTANPTEIASLRPAHDAQGYACVVCERLDGSPALQGGQGCALTSESADLGSHLWTGVVHCTTCNAFDRDMAGCH